MTTLKEWEAFYLIVGGAAAALTGLQFVVIVLGAEKSLIRAASTRAFATPTIVHFSAVLLLSALMTVPWHTLDPLRVCLMVAGVAGLIYTLLVIGHTRRQTHYTPVMEDWVWHAGLPIVAYGLLITAGGFLEIYEAAELFATGAVALLLLFTGIHNAWDAVIFIALGGPSDEEPPSDR